MGAVGKYDRFSDWLAEHQTGSVECSFLALDDLAGGLPRSARSHRAWWANDRRHVQAQAWLDAGFHVENVNLSAGRVVFLRGT